MGMKECRSQSQPSHIFGGLLMQRSLQKHCCLQHRLRIKAAAQKWQFAFNILNIMFSFITRTVTHGFILLLYNFFFFFSKKNKFSPQF